MPNQIDAFKKRTGVIRIVGHRGARGVFPENTMLGFEYTLASGVPLLEFDVVLTADDIPVITHNPTLHKPTFQDQTGQFISKELPIRSLSFVDLGRYEVGKIDGTTAYGAAFPDQAQVAGLRVPALAELCALVKQPRHHTARLLLELKSDPRLTDMRAHFVAQVLRVIRDHDVVGQTVLHSFDWEILAECKAQAPDIPTSFLSIASEPEFNLPDDLPAHIKAAGGALWCPHFQDITAEDVTYAQTMGLGVVVWTVNTIPDIDRMIDFGVDAICSDYPGRVQRRLSDRGLLWK